MERSSLTPPSVSIIDEHAMPSRLDAAIRRSLCVCFPADAGTFSRTRAWHGSAPAFSAVVESHGEVIAHAGVIDRTIAVDGAALRIAGIQNVLVLPQHRGRGLFAAVMKRSMDEAASRGLDCGLLFCVPALAPLYQRCGWITLEPRDVTRLDEHNQEVPLPPKNIAMFHPLRVSRFPAGGIHLRGNDW